MGRRDGREGRPRGPDAVARLGLCIDQGRAAARGGVAMSVTAPPRGPCLPPIRKTERARKANMPKVLIADELSERAQAIFDDRGIETDVKTGLSPAALVACIGAYDGLDVRPATTFTEQRQEAGTRRRTLAPRD